MADHASTTRPMTLQNVLLTFVPLSLALASPTLAGLSFYPMGMIVGGALFLAFRIFVVRLGLCRDHRRGVLLLRRGRFEEGHAAFIESEGIWRRRPFLDRYRAVLLGSATPYTFMILARYNQAYALSRLGRGDEALVLLNSVLEADPAMMIARELRDVLLAGARVRQESSGLEKRAKRKRAERKRAERKRDHRSRARVEP